MLAERLDRIASVRQDRVATIERLQRLLPDLIPSWGIAAGRHVLVTGADQRILARVPIDAALGDSDRILDVISAAQLLTLPGQQGGVTDMILPNGDSALATLRPVKSLPGQVIVIQEKIESLWGSDAALSVTLSATTGFVVLILGFAFHWQSTRAREGDLINDRCAAGSIPRSIADAADCGTGTCRAAESSGRSRCSPCSASTAAATF